MAEEPENLTIRLLQELRAEMRESFRQSNEAISDLTQRVDGNTLVFNLVAGVAHNHERRIDDLESKSH